MDIQEEIAQAIANSFFGMEAGHLPTEEWEMPVPSAGDMQLAFDIMPLVKRAQAVAVAEVLAKVAMNAEDLQHSRNEVRERIYGGHSVDWVEGYDSACGDVATWARREIEQGETA